METMLIHVNRGRALWVGAIALGGAALTAWFAWELADPNFSTGGSRRAAFLEDLPVWLRAGFMGLCSLACLWAVFNSVKAAKRTEPSFSIGPEGVADLRKNPPRRLAWSEIGEISSDANFLYVKPVGATGTTFAGGGRIAIPMKGVMPDREAILSAFRR